MMHGGEEVRRMGQYASFISVGLLVGVSFFVVSPILPQYVENYGVSYVDIGFFFTAYSLTWTVLQLYTGYLSDRYGRKRFVFVGLLTYGVFALLLGFARNFEQLIVFRVLQGVGLGIYGPAALGIVAQFEEKGKSLALYRTANSAGTIVGPILGGIAAHFGFSYTFLLSGLLSVAAIIPARYLREEKIEAAGANFLRSMKEILLGKNIVLICLASFLAELCFVALDIVIPLVGDSLGFSSLVTGSILASYFLAFTVVQFPLGVISERVDRKKLIASAAFFGALPFAFLYFSNNSILMSAAMGFLGVVLGAVFVQSGALVADLSPKGKESLYMAFFDSVIDFSFPVMPLIVTYLAMFGLKTPFLLLTSLMTLSGLTFLTLKK